SSDLTDGSLEAISTELGAPLIVIGSYQLSGDRMRVTARIVDVSAGDTVADAKVDGLLGNIFELQDRVVEQFSKEIGVVTGAIAPRHGSRDTTSLEAYRAFTEGWLELEALDIREIQNAI